MAATASSSSSSSITMDGFTYDVFLSFRVKDTCHGFTSNLQKALHDRGIHTFIGDKVEEIEILPSLFKAIEQSRMVIVVFSKNYAYSPFCLDELAKILHCITEKGQLVLPVFYKVHPSDVLDLRGSYRDAMATHEARSWYHPYTLHKWKNALKQVANLSSFEFMEGYDLIFFFPFPKRIIFLFYYDFNSLNCNNIRCGYHCI